MCSLIIIELSYKSITMITEKSQSKWRLNDTLLKITWIKEEYQELLKLY